MAGIWYRAGTVAVTSGSTKVVGTGTTWRGGVYKPDKGHMFWGPDGRAYEVDYVESDTVLYLVTAYTGQSATGQAYSIVISITGQVPAFSRELSAFVAYHQSQMDGWQQLLTGTGDVTLIAPDGTKKTVPSWDKVMNAGYGVVEQATEQAGIATAEAVKAAASAAAAGNAVVAAALPLPDVWAPLSDNLRMITGYGRDVLAGSDVVARVVNFSRNSTATYISKDGRLKTAEENEPRFEREGLLIEGQSTNLFHNSTPRGGVGFSAQEVPLFGGLIDAPIQLTVVAADAYLIRASAIATATVQTFSLYVNYAKSTARVFRFLTRNDTSGAEGEAFTLNLDELKAASGFSITVLDDEWIRVFAQIRCDVGNEISFYYGGTGSPTPPSPVGSFCYMYGLQCEPLPFPSSFIPTSGAAATRAADRAWIPAAGNRFVGGSYAIAFEFDILGHGSSLSRLLDFDNSGGLDRQLIMVSNDGALQCYIGGGFFATVAGKLAGVAAMRMSDFTMNAMMDGVAGSPVKVSGIGSSLNNRIALMNSNLFNQSSYGHIRNIRMWIKHQISNDQLRTAV